MKLFKKLGVFGLILALTVFALPRPVDAATATVILQAWGPGASGAMNQASTCDTLTGGGGGGFSQTNALTVSGGTAYTVNVPAGGASVTRGTNGCLGGNNGAGDTWFSTTGIAPTSVSEGVLADNGFAGQTGTGGVSGGNGGQSSSGIGDTKFSGGVGGSLSGTFGASGGGSSAGTAANGTNGTDAVNGNTSGGSAPSGGGNGGHGGDSTGGTSDGTIPGGGGGAYRDSGTGGSPSGAGARGQLIIKALLGTITSATGCTHTTDATYDIWTCTANGTWTPTIPAAAVVVAPPQDIIFDE